MNGAKTIGELMGESEEPLNTMKSIDDIISSANLNEFLSAALEDAVSVEASNSMREYGPREFGLSQMPERQIEAPGLGPFVETLAMGGVGGAKSLADIAKQIFKKSTVRKKVNPHWRNLTPDPDPKTLAKESLERSKAWKLLSKEQKEDVAKLYKKEFDLKTFERATKAEKGAEELLKMGKKKIHGKSLADYMKLEEGRTSLPGPTLPELVSLLLKKYSK